MLSIALISLLLFIQQAPAPPIADLNALAWLAGCWDASNQRTEGAEQWMKPSGRTMIGMSRTIARGKTVAYEFMRIEQAENGEISFISKPSGQPEATFKLVKHSANEVVFENPAHDFPQRVIYRLEKDGSLFARIEGKSQGKERGVNFPMKRNKCD